MLSGLRQHSSPMPLFGELQRARSSRTTESKRKGVLAPQNHRGNGRYAPDPDIPHTACRGKDLSSDDAGDGGGNASDGLTVQGNI